MGELLQFLEPDINAPREIQLTAKVDREQHLLAIRVEHRDTAVVRFQQGRDIALRGFLDVDDRERNLKTRKALHAGLDHLVLRGHRVHRMAAACIRRIGRNIEHVDRGLIDRVIEHVLDAPARSVLQLRGRYVRCVD